MAQIADLSVEFSHLYLDQASEAEAKAAAGSARRWLIPVITRYREAGYTVSTTVMIDDYFASDEASVEKNTELIRSSCANEGVAIDHVVYESACAHSVEKMIEHLMDQPRFGDGSSNGPTDSSKDNWLFNYAPGRDAFREAQNLSAFSLLTEEERRAVELQSVANAGSKETTQRARHAIKLEIELWKQTVVANGTSLLWSCPLLAAWWQLIRLGMFRDNGTPVLPEGTITREGAPSFFAKRT